MEVIKRNNNYRLVFVKDGCYEDIPCYISNFKIQIKLFWFWITIKEFKEGDYDDDAEFCKNEAIELYNKITNPYGKL